MTDKQTDRVGLEFISVFGLDPVSFVTVASDLGCRHVGMSLEPIVTCEGIDASWSLRNDAGLRRDLKAALREHDVAITLAEGFVAMPGEDIATRAMPDLELMAELGASRANILSIESDADRAATQCTAFTEAAASLGMTAVMEFLPGLPGMCDLPSALSVVRKVDRPDFSLLLDTMHVFRSGSTVADIEALDPRHIGYVQLCDVPLTPTIEDYADEARFERLAPGSGELPLQAFLRAVPKDVIVSLELPMRAAAEAGVSARDRLAGPVATTRQMLEQL